MLWNLYAQSLLDDSQRWPWYNIPFLPWNPQLALCESSLCICKMLTQLLSNPSWSLNCRCFPFSSQLTFPKPCITVAAASSAVSCLSSNGLSQKGHRYWSWSLTLLHFIAKSKELHSHLNIPARDLALPPTLFWRCRNRISVADSETQSVCSC